jgi:hypothetical protein
MNSYLRFSVSGLGATVTKATLRIYANSASTSGIGVTAESNTTWGETTLNYSNAPALGSLLGTTSPVAAGTWKELDVTNQVKGNGLVSFGLDTPGVTTISLASREAGANAPQLVVVSSSGQGATPTAIQTKSLTPAPTKAVTATPTRPINLTQTATPSGGSIVIAAAGDLT